MIKQLIVMTSLSFMSFAHADDDKWKEFEPKISKELRSKDVDMKLEAIKLFSEHDYEEAGEYLIKLTYKLRKDPTLAAAAGAVLAEFKNEETREQLKTIVNKKPDACLPLLQAYFAQADEDTKELALKILDKSRENTSITEALNHLLKHPNQDEKVVKKVVSLMGEDNYHSIRRSAATALGGFQSPLAVPPLIEAVDDLVIGEISQDSLWRLTEQEFGKNKAGWQSWWKANSESFEPAKKSLEEGVARRTEIDDKVKKDAAENKNEESFYGIPLEGKSILFVLDRSGSMSADNRMEKLKEEIYYIIECIDERRNFGFVLFPHETYPSRGVSRATDSFKRRAHKFAEDLQPSGSTPISEAMTYAFKKVVEKSNVDTIYLLTDGQPNKPQDEVLALINGLNQGYYVKIHTISLAGPSPFLKKVAESNGGNFHVK